MQSEKEIEQHFIWTVQRLGGQSYKFKSMNNRGVADRIACLPGGVMWFVELKRPSGGRLSPLQKVHRQELLALQQNYACLYSIEEVNEWAKNLTEIPH